jgi:hypothetical protein
MDHRRGGQAHQRLGPSVAAGDGRGHFVIVAMVTPITLTNMENGFRQELLEPYTSGDLRLRNRVVTPHKALSEVFSEAG